MLALSLLVTSKSHIFVSFFKVSFCLIFVFSFFLIFISISLSLLVTSKSYIFVSLFKIFFMICLFGLFHGLILLPVVLAILGPVEEENKKVTPANKGKDKDKFIDKDQCILSDFDKNVCVE